MLSKSSLTVYSELIKLCMPPLRNVQKAARNSGLKHARYTVHERRFSTIKSKILSSKYPDIEIPSVSLMEYLQQETEKWADKTAIICGVTGQRYTYYQLRKKWLKFAVSLQKIGLQKGDVIAIILPNIPDYPIVLFGGIEAGLTVTTVNPNYTSYEINKQLVSCNAKCIVTLEDMYPLTSEAIKDFQKRPHVIVIRGKNIPVGTIKFEELIDDSVDSSRLTKHQADPDDVILLPYSSGTTGLPKGVMLTHRNIVSNLIQMREPEISMTRPATNNEQDVVSAVLPLFHIYGMNVVMMSRFCDGCKIVSLPKFEPASFLSSTVEQKVNVMYIVPPLLIFLATHSSVRKEHLQFLRSVMCGAAPSGQSDAERFLEKAQKHINFVQGYGMTETSPCLIMLPIGSKKLSSTGIVLASTEVKLQNPETGELLGPNEMGELLVRGPQVMKGYLNNPAATEQIIDKSGWLKTGDILYYDEEEYFYVKDRLKEVIKVKGFQVAPAELEELLRTHPSVLEAAVVGVPDQRAGELPRAFVVLNKQGTVTEKELQNFISPKVSEYKQLSGGIRFVESIPKSPSGKLLRRKLKEEFL